MIRWYIMFLFPCFVSAAHNVCHPSDVRSHFLTRLIIAGYPLLLSVVSTNQWSLFSLNDLPHHSIERPIIYDNTLFDTNRTSKVLNFFPVPVEEECLSEEKRRRGICMNTYECRIQHGKSHGPCALGFGVCCIFTSTCGEEVQNNLTYVTSPGFPNLIDRPMNCSVIVRKIDKQITQLRIDFIHFNIGQPNIRNGVCNEDVMEIKSGNKSLFQLCGWNSGQHLYIDLAESNDPVTFDFRLSSQLQSRMWEMRIVQLDFEQRAPVGCLQYFRSGNGTLKTLNYLSNGRYLANQDYLMCIRQEIGMCGVAYTPCSPESFRIGPKRPFRQNQPFANSGVGNISNTYVLTTARPNTNFVNSAPGNAPNRPGSNRPNMPANNAGSSPGANRPNRPGINPVTSNAINSGVPANNMSNRPGNISPSTSVNDIDSDANIDNTIDGSGSGPTDTEQEVMLSSDLTSQEPITLERQCNDRVLIPCDFEEFITPGNDAAGICSLEHCGNSLCGPNELDAGGNCRIETWATPFRIRVAFGPGQDTGTSLEDNLGMCLMYEQLPCVP